MSIANMIRRVTNLVPVLLIRFYRGVISPMFPSTCRFYPSCSAYGLESFQKHHFLKAAWLTTWRILRCNPFNPGGFDPVPPLPGQTYTPEELAKGEAAFRLKFGIDLPGDEEQQAMPAEGVSPPDGENDRRA